MNRTQLDVSPDQTGVFNMHVVNQARRLSSAVLYRVSVCLGSGSQRASSFGNNLASTREEADDSGSSSSKVHVLTSHVCLHDL